eukprot:gene17814-biopygen8359
MLMLMLLPMLMLVLMLMLMLMLVPCSVDVLMPMPTLTQMLMLMSMLIRLGALGAGLTPARPRSEESSPRTKWVECAWSSPAALLSISLSLIPMNLGSPKDRMLGSAQGPQDSRKAPIGRHQGPQDIGSPQGHPSF